MAPIRPLLAAGVIAVSALAGCTSDSQPGDAPATCGAAPLVEPGETTTIVRPPGDPNRFRVKAAAFLPDGEVLVAAETNVPEAGDEVLDRRPILFVVAGDGECAPFDLPVVAGTAVTSNAVPMATGDDGALFVWDPDNHRIVRRGMTGAWTTAVTIPSRLHMYGEPAAAVAADGTLYVRTDAAVQRVRSGELEIVAGRGETPARFLDPRTLPAPATAAALPALGDVAASADGALFLTTRNAILRVDQDGMLRAAASPETTRGQDGAIVREQEGTELRSTLTGVAVTPDGDLLIGDTGMQRVLLMREGQASVLMHDVTALAPGHPLDADATKLLALGEAGAQLLLIGLDG